MGLAGLGLAVRLAALAKLHPEEFDCLVEWQGLTGELRGAPAVLANQAGLLRADAAGATAHIAATFGLHYVGSGRRKLPFGYCRLPSVKTTGRRFQACVQYYMARYAP